MIINNVMSIKSATEFVGTIMNTCRADALSVKLYMTNAETRKNAIREDGGKRT